MESFKYLGLWFDRRMKGSVEFDRKSRGVDEKN